MKFCIEGDCEYDREDMCCKYCVLKDECIYEIEGD